MFFFVQAALAIRDVVIRGFDYSGIHKNREFWTKVNLI